MDAGIYDTIKILGCLVILSAIAAIWFKQHQGTAIYAKFKAFTTILILLAGIIIYIGVQSNYSAIMIAALTFCLAGDILLTRKKLFIYGLLSFMAANIWFTIAFVSIHGFSFKIFPLSVLAIIYFLLFIYLRRSLNRYLIPIIIYSCIIIIMTWQASALLYNERSIPAFSIAAGSFLFLFSDLILALNKFKKTFKVAEILILSFYWIAIFAFTLAGIYLS
ncbi:MAG TPA: lysoplasmalogenase [Bacteroidales bacterium]|nr:lysoplasmalogenase [Bacteroidales bacterium]